MLPPVLVPSENAVKSFTSLTTMPILETVPRAVPLSVTVRYPDEQFLGRLIPLKAELPAAHSNIKTINAFDGFISDLDEILITIYASRGIAKVLSEYTVEEVKRRGIEGDLPEWKDRSSGISEIAVRLVTPKGDLLKKLKEKCQDIAQAFNRLFCDLDKDKSVWLNAFYTDSLLDQVCLLLFKLGTIEHVALSKASFIDDVSYLLKLSQTRDESFALLRMWAGSRQAATNDVLKGLSTLTYEQTYQLFTIFTQYLRRRMNEDLCVNPNLFFAYLHAFLFFVRLYEQQRNNEFNAAFKAKQDKYNQEAKRGKPKEVDRKALLKTMKFKPLDAEMRSYISALIVQYPIIPFYFEVAALSDEGLPNEVRELSAKEDKKVRIPYLTRDELLEIGRRNFSELSQLIARMGTAEDPAKKYGQQLVEKLPVVLATNAKMLSRVRELITLKIAKPPETKPAGEEQQAEREEEKTWTPFERAMRKHLTDNDKSAVLLMLYLSRSTKELMSEHLPLLTQVISSHVHQTMHKFSQTLSVAALRNTSVRGGVADTLARLRGLLAAWEGRLPAEPPKCAPHRELVEFARIQIQTFINSGSDTVKKLRGDDREAFERFVAESRFFADLLGLGGTIERTYDQSALFFKEVALAMANRASFPVRTSLPLVLSEYVMNHYSTGELANAIYYPLSIYDDAASTALRVLKSRFLYDEIKAEARICLISITRLIADSAFTPIRRFCALRLVSRKMAEALRKDPRIGDAPFAESLSAVRLGTILEQNQLSVLGCKVDTKALIADRLNDLMAQELKKTVDLTDSHGALVAVAVARILDILRSTNELFLSSGLPVMPFTDQLSRALSTDTPNALRSGLLANVTDHLLVAVISDYYLLTYPLRLVPPSPPRLSLAQIFVGQTGAIIEGMLLPTAAFLTVENFRELFWLLDDGAIALMHDQVVQVLAGVFKDFTAAYRRLAPRLTRIADAPIAMTCAQVFDRFEGAYRYFASDQVVLALMKVMAQIGNILAVCEMMDNAFALKISATTQIGTFLLGRNPSVAEAREPELFAMFDAKFKTVRDMMTNLYSVPAESEALPPFLCGALLVFAEQIRANAEVFEESSANLLDIKAMTGFASRWSVLEFLFCLLESTRKNKEDVAEDQPIAPGSVAQFGEGVLVCAAAILCACRQRPLYRLLAIGERIRSHQLTDFNAVKEERVKLFLAVSEWVSASLACALASLQLPLTQILSAGR